MDPPYPYRKSADSRETSSQNPLWMESSESACVLRSKVQVVRQVWESREDLLLPKHILQLEMWCGTGRIGSEMYEHHHTIRHSMTDHIPRHVQPCRACGAVVVDIVDGDLRHAELVEDALTAGRVTVAVTGDALVDIIIVDLGVEEGFDAGFEAELSIINCGDVRRAEGYGGIKFTFASGFDELGETYA